MALAVMESATELCITPRKYPCCRREEIDYYGFDNIGTAYLTQFVITTLDDWPMIAHPLIDKHGLNEVRA